MPFLHRVRVCHEQTQISAAASTRYCQCCLCAQSSPLADARPEKRWHRCRRAFIAYSPRTNRVYTTIHAEFDETHFPFRTVDQRARGYLDDDTQLEALSLYHDMNPVAPSSGGRVPCHTQGTRIFRRVAPACGVQLGLSPDARSFYIRMAEKSPDRDAHLSVGSTAFRCPVRCVACNYKCL